MKPSGKQVKQIQEALLDAYPTRDTLRMMVRYGLDQNLDAIATGDNLQVLVFNLVNWAEQYGRLDELVQQAYLQNPGNPSMQSLVEALTTTGPTSPGAGQPVVDAVFSRNSPPASIDVYLSYSRRDTDLMRLVRETLRATGLMVWTDEGLEPGTPNWRAAIEEAIRQSKALVVLLSPTANASHWVDNEVAYAQQCGIRVFPILVSGTPADAVPINLVRVQWLDGRQDLQGVLVSEMQPVLLRHIGQTIARPKPDVKFDWIVIPGGAFMMGSNPYQDKLAASDEMPQHQLSLSRFCISRFPITILQYGSFLNATGHAAPKLWDSLGVGNGREDHPITNVSWYDAQSFCEWADVKLPSEAEWEKAARGRDGRLYPWGDQQPQRGRGNYDRILDDTSPVGAFPDGDSPYGVSDLAGNVLEWTRSNWGTDFASAQYGYPYYAGDGRENSGTDRKMLRTLRGGAFNLGEACLRCTFRTGGVPGRGRPNIGFRVVWSDTK